jgi:hypothetical protein
MKNQTLIYEVDKNGVIISIKGPWDQFAKSNDGKPLAKSETIGRNLFDMIHGAGVVHIYRTMQGALFSSPGKTIAFAYRCDAPDMRRFMKMEMKASGKRVVYRSTVEKEEPVSPPIRLDYGRRAEDFIVMCSFCKDFRYPPESGRWSPIERVFESAPAVFGISHGICPSCLEMRYKEEMDDSVDEFL